MHSISPWGALVLFAKSRGITHARPQVLAFLSALASTGATLIVPVIQAPGIYPTISIAHKMYEASGIDVFPHLILDSMMIGTEYNMLTKFFRMKLPTFQGTEFENAFEFIIDCYDRSQKMGKGFNKVSDYVKKLKGVTLAGQAKMLDKSPTMLGILAHISLRYMVSNTTQIIRNQGAYYSSCWPSLERGCYYYGAIGHFKMDYPLRQSPSIESVSVVSEFQDVFPSDLSGMPPDRDIDFCIDLESSTYPIPILPYQIASAELRKLKTQ
ncbi:hypothetical protein FXO37_13759 [Capsicum annuum]|nr:hypothetical protein FXO37_13759 [Capsicum annuum]